MYTGKINVSKNLRACLEMEDLSSDGAKWSIGFKAK
jgi:hypothetical protein